MGKLYYRGNHIYYDFYDQHGKRHQPALKIKVEKRRKTPDGRDIFPPEAQQIKAAIDKEVLLGTWGLEKKEELPAIRLQAAFDMFLKPYRNPNTRHAYQLSFDKLLSYFKDIEVEAIDESLMLDFRADLFTKHKDVTVEFFIRHTKIFFKWVEEEGYIRRSPVTKRVKMKPIVSDIVIFSDPDLDYFWKELKKSNIDAYYQLYFLLMTGWRVSDSCELTWEKIIQARMVIKHYIGKPDKYWEYPMDAELSKYMEKLPRTHQPFVFFYRDYHNLGKEFRLIADRLGEDGKPMISNHRDLSIHTLRKQFCFNCFRRGVPLEICSKLLGHSSVKTTERYYTYWDTQLLRDGLATSRKVLLQNGDKTRKRKKKEAA